MDGAGPPEGAAPAGGVGPAAPTLQIRLPVLTLARAFANEPGQKGSMLTPAALMKASILVGYEGIDLNFRDHHLFVLQDEGRVDAGELGDRHHVVDSWHGASRWIK